MLVEVEAEGGAWAIRYNGKVIAKAESLALSNVNHRDGCLRGALTAAWGVTVVKKDLHDSTRMRLVGLRPFNYRGCKPMGNITNITTANRLIINGNEIVGC